MTPRSDSTRLGSVESWLASSTPDTVCASDGKPIAETRDKAPIATARQDSTFQFSHEITSTHSKRKTLEVPDDEPCSESMFSGHGTEMRQQRYRLSNRAYIGSARQDFLTRFGLGRKAVFNAGIG